LRPDAKSQVTIEYSDDNVPVRINTIVVSTQHDDFGPTDEGMLAKIKSDVIAILIPRVVATLPAGIQALFNDAIIYHVNPTGKFVIGGPHGDTGLTAEKLLWTLTAEKVHTAAGHFQEKIQVKWTEAVLMPHVILPKIWLQQVLPMKFWCRFLMPLALQNLWEFM